MPTDTHEIEQHFLALLRRNQKILYKVCWLFGRGNAYLFQELKAEIIVALWNEMRQHGLSRFRHECKESTWISSIAFYVAMSYTRSQSRHNESVALTQSLPEVSLDTEEQEGLQCLEDLLDKLDVDDRRWVMYYLEDYSYEAISQQEGISEVAARKRMSRLIEKLRKISKQ